MNKLVFILSFLGYLSVFSQCDTTITGVLESFSESEYYRGNGVFIATNEGDYQKMFKMTSAIDFEKKMVVAFFNGIQGHAVHFKFEIKCLQDSNLLKYTIFAYGGRNRMRKYTSQIFVIDKLDLTKLELEIIINARRQFIWTEKYNDDYLIFDLEHPERE